MDANTELALSVVAVMVVHDPGPEFDDVLQALADQDYPNLKTLFLVAGDAADLPARIRDKIPSAFVRAVVGNPGFGAAANEVVRLVEGDNGFFMMMHDDVALDPGATRALVEELYRSNAGIVGPKLVLWDEPSVLQHVGLGVDRFGEIDPLVESGEVDQEQHDAVRDVFALPSACMLVRADLFRAIGGFDTTTPFFGEDLDLCWRAHLSGARVVVVPAARGRHAEGLAQRRSDLNGAVMSARHRVHTVATLTGGLRLPLVLLQMLLISLAGLVVGLFTGRFGEAFASLRATLGLLPRVGSVVRRRREVSKLRRVPYREVAGLQIRGSARLSSYLRNREQQHMAVDHSAVGSRRFTRNTAGRIAAWSALIVLAVIGSRTFFTDGVPNVGEYLNFPSSTRSLLSDYWSGWWGHGLGSTTAVPTGIGLLGVGGIVSIGHMGLFHTLAVLAWLPFGYFGAWRLMSIFPSSRARIVGLVAYAAVPLPYSALGAGRWGVVAVYGAAPWIVHLLRTAARIEPALSARADADVADALGPIDRREQIRRIAQLALLTAVVTAFVPTFAGLVVVVGLGLALATVLGRGSLGTAAVLLGSSVLAAAAGFALNLPWIATQIGTNGWDAFVGAPSSPTSPKHLVDLLRFEVGPSKLGVLAVALWLPVVIAPLLARGWRLTWAGRGGILAVGMLGLAVLSTGDRLPFRLPEIGLLLGPAAVGLAVAAACAAAAFEQDVQGASFGWRQPLGVLSGAAIVFGAIPAVLATSNGHWSTPSTELLQPTEQFAENPPEGDYRTLFIGDARVMPLDGWRFDDTGTSGVSFTVVDDGPLTIGEHWAGRPTSTEDDVESILHLIARSSTARGGRLLAPFSVRYIVIPLIDGIESTTADPLGAPAGLVEDLTTQLDLARLITPPNYIAFENAAWIPTEGTLSGPAAGASTQAGPEALASIDIAGSTPTMIGMNPRGPGTGQIEPGVFHLAIPFDDHWQLTVGGVAQPSRVAFGSTMAFDVTTSGPGVVTYRTDGSRHVAVIAQLVAWLLLAVVASRLRWSFLRGRRTVRLDDDRPVLNLGDGSADLPPWHVQPAAMDGEQRSGGLFDDDQRDDDMPAADGPDEPAWSEPAWSEPDTTEPDTTAPEPSEPESSTAESETTEPATSALAPERESDVELDANAVGDADTVSGGTS